MRKKISEITEILSMLEQSDGVLKSQREIEPLVSKLDSPDRLRVGKEMLHAHGSLAFAAEVDVRSVDRWRLNRTWEPGEI